MRLRQRLALVLIVIALAGCLSPEGESIVPANMPELKEALGVTQKALPPLAKAQANATQVVAGSPVRFTAEGSSDPQALPLTYAWDFGDGATGAGPEAVHAYATPGEYDARLVLTNAGGASDQAVVPVRVLAQDRAPIASLRVTDATGADPASVERGAPLTFDASSSQDPEGGALSYRWDFGDGATSLEPRATHAFDAPGAHVVKLVVQDAGGRSSSATRAICVGASYAKDGTLTLTGDARETLLVPVGAGIRTLSATLAFDGGLGANDVQVALVAPDGKEAARSSGATAPAAQGDQAREASVDAPAPGEWTVQVVRQSAGPTGASYSLVVREAC